MKAFLGMGLLGSNFVKAMIRKGETVQVWNRTPSRAKALEAFGAKAYNDVSQAVKGVERIHVTLKDDASVDEVLAAASEGFSPGAIIIDHTTTSKEGAIKRTAEWTDKGFYYQHAPVFMGPSNALESTGFMLVSGDENLLATLQPELSAMTGKLLHFGTEPGHAAAMKLVGNTFLVCLTGGLRDSLAVAKASGVATTDVLELFNSWNPATQLTARLGKMTGGDFTNPSWELNMARKDAGLFLQTAAKAGIELAMIPGAAALMDQWIDKGYGAQDWTVIGSDTN
jgi:3-hydroxyisobutyrate dehydrogenase